VVSSVIPIALEKILNKKDMSIMPSRQETPKEDPETGEDLSEGRKKKKNLKSKKVKKLNEDNHLFNLGKKNNGVG